jgi:hypothetical protein
MKMPDPRFKQNNEPLKDPMTPAFLNEARSALSPSSGLGGG